MEKKKTKLSKSFKVSIPQNKKIPPLSCSPNQGSNVDKTSFIKSLHLITSDGSTDDEKINSSNISCDSENDLTSPDINIASESNISIEEYYWKNPWNNTPVHAHGLIDGKSSKSRKSSNSAVKQTIDIKSKEKKMTKMSSEIVYSHDKRSANSISKKRKINKSESEKNAVLENKKHSKQKLDEHDLDSRPQKGRLDTLRHDKKLLPKREKKIPIKLKDFCDDPKSEFTSDSASDVDIVTVSKEGVMFSSEHKNKKQNSMRNKWNTPSSSEKKRKKLYSFKEKFSEEVDPNNISNNVSNTLDEIGDALLNIAESIENKITPGKRTKSIKKFDTKSTSTANTVLESEEQHLEHVTCNKQMSDNPNEKLKDHSPESKKDVCLIGKGSNSGSKSKKKRLSEILPVPRKSKAKRKILDESEKELTDFENESDTTSEVSYKIARVEADEREVIPPTLENFPKETNLICSFAKKDRDSGLKIDKMTRNKKSKSSIELSTDGEGLIEIESQMLSNTESSPKCNIEKENEGDSATIQGRSLRNRRRNIGLNDYVQPKRRIYNKRTAKKSVISEDKIKDTEIHTCLRCQVIYSNLGHLKHHLMSFHNALWDKSCPEGLTDEKSLAIIIKKIGKLCCPKCGKELKHMHYYRKHVQWCGREHEKYFCDLCEKFIMIMWQHEHELMHVRKDKMEEIDKENASVLAEKEIVIGETSNDRKRLAAKKAEKLLIAINKSYEGAVDLTSDDKDPDAEVLSESSDEDVIMSGSYIDEEELEEIKVANDSKHMYTGSHFANTFYKNLEHCKEMDHCSNVQFPQFCPRVPEWNPLAEDDIKPYLPSANVSPEFLIKSCKKTDMSQDLKQIKVFEALNLKDYGLIFTGGPVWGLAWCPYPHNVRQQYQYLAVSCHPDMDTVHQVTETNEGPGLIQIWNTGKLNHAVECMTTPKLEFCIAHDYGVVRKMAWCPHRCWQTKETILEENRLRQIGLLAIACGDGSIRIFSVSNPELLNNSSSPTVYRPTPEVTLVGHKIRRSKTPSCTSLSWSVKESYMLGGYGDGSVRIWNLETDSTLLRVPTPDQGLLLLPFRTFLPHSKTVTDLSWSPHCTKYFMTASIDRTVKLWCLDNLVTPQITAKSSALTAAIWPSVVQSVVYAEDDVYAQQTCQMRIHSYGDLRDKNRALNAPLQRFLSGIWDISISNWHLMVFGCDFTGNVMFTYYPAVFGEKKPHKSKLVSIMDISLLKIKCVFLISF
ncbi:GTF3C2 [Mytilus coruscus]|uniref:GTF3C2 n=1 Tax=Mytilus coruscus TaxID=42192 RepID=A0A6J8BMN3_MYTCO|nr:GTF3C2 [Mytilus coruscus]